MVTQAWCSAWSQKRARQPTTQSQGKGSLHDKSRRHTDKRCSALVTEENKAAHHTVTGQRQPAGQVQETARADLPECCCAQPSAPQSPPPVPTAGLGLDSTLWSPWPVPEMLFECHSLSHAMSRSTQNDPQSMEGKGHTIQTGLLYQGLLPCAAK